jgi:hypothetical protein
MVAEAERGRVNGHASPGSAVFDALILLLGGDVQIDDSAFVSSGG